MHAILNQPVKFEVPIFVRSRNVESLITGASRIEPIFWDAKNAEHENSAPNSRSGKCET